MFQIRMQIWDTAGQERFRGITKMYYRDSHAAIVVYDITSSESFEIATKWVQELRDNVSKIEILLAGNKSDLEEERIVNLEEVEAFASKHEVTFCEVSAKNN